MDDNGINITMSEIPVLELFPTWGNITGLSHHMKFNDGHKISIVVYSILFVLSAIGNITVLSIILKRKRTTNSRINTMVMHLAIADLIVTFFMMPLEIVWSMTVSWWFGDTACRVMSFLRIFGLYLSSFVLVCISIDRYFAVLKPMNLSDIDRRGKFMLACAWAGSILCSAPQVFVFHVEAHANFSWYEQCISWDVYTTTPYQFAYQIFMPLMSYIVPLIVIIVCYSSILCEIYRRSREPISDKFRRSSLGFLGRAKSRTLKMTITIVVVFVVCWTPYYIICFWYWLYPTSANSLDVRIQKGLFLFACTNSCMNPIVYGAFNIRTRRRAPGQGEDTFWTPFTRVDRALRLFKHLTILATTKTTI